MLSSTPPQNSQRLIFKLSANCSLGGYALLWLVSDKEGQQIYNCWKVMRDEGVFGMKEWMKRILRVFITAGQTQKRN